VLPILSPGIAAAVTCHTSPASTASAVRRTGERRRCDGSCR